MHSRRQFLAMMCGLLSGVIGAILGVPLLVFSVAPLLRRQKNLWVKVCPTSGVQKGEPMRFVYSFLREDAYLQKTERGTVYVMTDDGRYFTVLSNVCPHAGCGVRWDRQSKAFLCPCHNGRFDAKGKVIAGPPPKPLNEVVHEARDGFLFIKMKA